MRRLLLAAAGLVVGLGLCAAPAQALTLPAAPLKQAAAALDPTVTVHCRTVWRCGYYGCGWRRVCWGPPVHYRPYGYHHPYRYYRPYVRYYRPYWHARPYYPAYVPPPWVSGPWGLGPRYYHIGPAVFWY
jgi:hypothetical protein